MKDNKAEAEMLAKDCMDAICIGALRSNVESAIIAQIFASLEAAEQRGREKALDDVKKTWQTTMTFQFILWINKEISALKEVKSNA